MQSYLNFLSSAIFCITFSPKCKFCLPFCLFPPAAVRAICERLKTSLEPHPPLGGGLGRGFPSRQPHPPLGEGWGGASPRGGPGRGFSQPEDMSQDGFVAHQDVGLSRHTLIYLIPGCVERCAGTEPVAGGMTNGRSRHLHDFPCLIVIAVCRVALKLYSHRAAFPDFIHILIRNGQRNGCCICSNSLAGHGLRIGNEVGCRKKGCHYGGYDQYSISDQRRRHLTDDVPDLLAPQFYLLNFFHDVSLFNCPVQAGSLQDDSMRHALP